MAPSNLQHSTQMELQKCARCGADNLADVVLCWLCRKPMAGGGQIVMAELVVKPHRRITEVISMITLGVAAIVVVLIGIGLAAEEPGTLIGYAIIVGLPLSASAVRLLIRRSRTGPITWGERLLTVFVSTIATFAILTVLVVAIAVAVVAYCFYSLAQY